MRKPLPPLTSLRAFEAAARHLSLKRAAEELNVTPAAISHQIQQLEAALSAQLFRRGHRSVALTEIGQMLAPRLQEGFDCLGRAIESVRERRAGDVLTIITPPSFVSGWLMPRLHRFVGTHPSVDVQVSTRIRQFARLPPGPRGDVESVRRWAEESDLVIALGHGDYPGMQIDRLLELSITPLCSPRLLEECKLLHPSDLRNTVLLHDDRGMIYEGRPFWDMWLAAAGEKGLDTGSGQHFSHSSLAVEAAIAGRGVVASTIELVESAVDAGQLVAPFGMRIPWESSYYLVTSKSASLRPQVQQFRRWILETLMRRDGCGGST